MACTPAKFTTEKIKDGSSPVPCSNRKLGRYKAGHFRSSISFSSQYNVILARKLGFNELKCSKAVYPSCGICRTQICMIAKTACDSIIHACGQPRRCWLRREPKPILNLKVAVYLHVILHNLPNLWRQVRDCPQAGWQRYVSLLLD